MKWPEGLDELASRPAERQALLARLAPQVSPQDYQLIAALCEVWATVGSKANLSKLQLFLGHTTEKTDRVCPPPPPSATPAPAPPDLTTSPPKGHGRCPARRYTGARWTHVNHPSLRPGARCPKCQKGKVRAQRRRGLVLRISAAPPICAHAWSLERLRCDTCGELFTAP